MVAQPRHWPKQTACCHAGSPENGRNAESRVHRGRRQPARSRRAHARGCRRATVGPRPRRRDGSWRKSARTGHCHAGGRLYRDGRLAGRCGRFGAPGCQTDTLIAFGVTDDLHSPAPTAGHALVAEFKCARAAASGVSSCASRRRALVRLTVEVSHERPQRWWIDRSETPMHPCACASLCGNPTRSSTYLGGASRLAAVLAHHNPAADAVGPLRSRASLSSS